MAKRFDFRLSAVLRVREAEEEKKKKELGEVQLLINKANEQIEKQEKNRLETSEALAQISQEAQPDLTQIRLYRQFIATVDAHRQALNAEKLALEEQANIRRQALATAQKDRKSIELLKERDYDEWLSALNKEEAKVQDEIAAQSFRNKKKRDER
jgi:flagellar FliJ protein